MVSFTGLLILVLIAALVLSVVLSFMKKLTKTAIWLVILALLVIGSIHLLKGII